jgi:hypothetical protein
MKHKHYDMIVAWAEGKDIQFKAFSHSDWEDVDMKGEEWYEHYTYRIKPMPKPDFYTYLTITHSHTGTQTLCKYGSDNVKFTYDGETRKLKSAEVL